MTTDNDIINEYRRDAAHLQKLGLDKITREASHHDNFKTIVYAEVLIDDSIRRDQRKTEAGEPMYFFRQGEFGRYRGSSKPTWRLCALYFGAQPDGVTVQPSHHDLYYKWRAPDISVDGGEKVRKQRNAVLERMVLKVHKDVFKVIREKSVGWEGLDPNASPTNPRTSDLTSQMSMLMVADAPESAKMPDMAREVSGGDEEDEEDEEGGEEDKEWLRGL